MRRRFSRLGPTIPMMKNKSANLSEGTEKSSYEALFSIQSHHPNEIKKSAYLSKKTAQKIELLCAFLDNGPTILRKKGKINRPICRTPDKRNRKNRVTRRFFSTRTNHPNEIMKKINRLICRTQDEVNEKIELLGAFLDSDQPSK